MATASKTQTDQADPDKARWMALDSYPASTAAIHLCEELVRKLDQSKVRVNKRGTKTVHIFEGAVAAFITDLFKAAEMSAGRWSWRTLMTSKFKGGFVSYRRFITIFKSGLAVGFIEMLEAKRNFHQFEEQKIYAKGKATRLRATASLLQFAEQWGIRPENIDQHFKQRESLYGVVLKEGSQRIRGTKIQGKRITFKKTDLSERLDNEVRELNRFLRKHEIVGGHHKGYERIFNEGTPEGYRWNKGGRLYSVGEGNYQTLKKDQRLRMTLDGQDVVEIDVRASYLTILHGLKKQPFSPLKDPYVIPGIPREVVKAWVTMTLGHAKFHSKWPARSSVEFRSKGIELGKKYSLKELQPTILAHLPVMVSWPEQNLTVFDLMFSESQAMVGTMLQLMHEGVPSLSVHDSIIVQLGSQTHAERVLREQFHRVCGITPTLEVH